MQEIHNSIANALELHLSCTNPSICNGMIIVWCILPHFPPTLNMPSGDHRWLWLLCNDVWVLKCYIIPLDEFYIVMNVDSMGGPIITINVCIYQMAIKYSRLTLYIVALCDDPFACCDQENISLSCYCYYQIESIWNLNRCCYILIHSCAPPSFFLPGDRLLIWYLEIIHELCYFRWVLHVGIAVKR